MGGPAEDGFHDLPRPGPERPELPLVHDHVVRGRDHVAESPPELPDVPDAELLPRRGRVAPVPGPEPLEPHLRRGMDRDDLDGLAEMLPEDVELHEPAEPAYHNALPLIRGRVRSGQIPNPGRPRSEV